MMLWLLVWMWYTTPPALPDSSQHSTHCNAWSCVGSPHNSGRWVECVCDRYESEEMEL